MALTKRKNPHSEITTKQGLLTNKAIHKKASKALEEAKEITKDKPVYFSKKGEGEFSRSIKNKS